MKTRLLIAFIILTSPLLVQSVYSLELDTSSYSLKQQIKEGWDIESLFCHNDQVLILKINDKSPACVNPETKEKLLERGWAILTPKERLYDIEKTLSEKDCVEFGKWLDEHADGNFNENLLIFDLPVSYELSQRIHDSISDCVNDEFDSFTLNTKHFMDYENFREASIVIINADVRSAEFGNPLVPKEITIVLGENNKITWINTSDTPLSLVSDDGDEFWWTGRIDPGKSASVTFNQTGVFEYHGNPGPWITGKVIILENNSFDASAETTHEIIGKRVPVDVPDATSENDMFCQTNWNIITIKELDPAHIEQSVRSTIAQFGMTYFLEERKVTISENSSGYVVSISGLWDRKSVQYMMITEDLENFGVKVQGEPASCQ